MARAPDIALELHAAVNVLAGMVGRSERGRRVAREAKAAASRLALAARGIGEAGDLLGAVEEALRLADQGGVDWAMIVALVNRIGTIRAGRG